MRRSSSSRKRTRFRKQEHQKYMKKLRFHKEYICISSFPVNNKIPMANPENQNAEIPMQGHQLYSASIHQYLISLENKRKLA